MRRILCLVKPTPVVQPPLGKPLLWRLISALSLNHLSLVEEGREALRELLRLHNAGDSASGERQIQGLVAVRSAPSFARVLTVLGLEGDLEQLAATDPIGRELQDTNLSRPFVPRRR